MKRNDRDHRAHRPTEHPPPWPLTCAARDRARAARKCALQQLWRQMELLERMLGRQFTRFEMQHFLLGDASSRQESIVLENKGAGEGT